MWEIGAIRVLIEKAAVISKIPMATVGKVFICIYFQSSEEVFVLTVYVALGGGFFL